MKFLFIHQNFPAQYLHLLRHLSAQNRHEILYLTEHNGGTMPGVRKILRNRPRPSNASTHRDAQEWEMACHRAQENMMAAKRLLALGFVPDIIIGHHGWGELLNLQDVWPDTPILGYFEFYYRIFGGDLDFDPEFPVDSSDFPRIRGKNTINLVALNNPGHGQTPTQFQLSTYPQWAHSRISLLHEGVDLQTCRPNPAWAKDTVTIGGYKIAPGEKLVTYVARDLEPYRGIHAMLRAVPHMQQARPDLRVIIVGGDGASYGAACPRGTWRQYFLDQLGGKIDLTRVHFTGKLPYDGFVKLLQRSDAHVYLTYPFVLSWSLREALATGCALVGSDTAPVREFVMHKKTGLLADFHNPRAIADAVLELLENRSLATRLRKQARAWAEANLSMTDYMANYEKLIDDLVEGRIAWRR